MYDFLDLISEENTKIETFMLHEESIDLFMNDHIGLADIFAMCRILGLEFNFTRSISKYIIS
jgi:hypothetical protein